jgi:cytochrome c peroxidase
MHKFKVPQLYNMKDVGFYFHGGSKRSLREVVEYFNDGVPENPIVPAAQIAYNFRPLGLTESEMDDLTEFLENGLYDPDMLRYKPDAVMSGNCFPDNDRFSRDDMDCD